MRICNNMVFMSFGELEWFYNNFKKDKLKSKDMICIALSKEEKK